jgi:quinol monooxygenase YgiN
VIYMTARFRIKPETLNACVYVISDLIEYIKANEPGTLQYTSVNDFDDPYTFLHFFVFEDEAAEERHRHSPGTTQFIEALYPNLEGDVEFSRWREVATT